MESGITDIMSLEGQLCYQSNNENQSEDTTKTPGFEVFVLFAGLVLVIAIRKKMK